MTHFLDLTRECLSLLYFTKLRNLHTVSINVFLHKIHRLSGKCSLTNMKKGNVQEREYDNLYMFFSFERITKVIAPNKA